MHLTTEFPRLLIALLLCAAYAGLCLMAWRQSRRAMQTPQLDGAWLVAHASQTGTARQLAEVTTKALRAAGLSVSHCELGQLDPAQLQQVERALFVVSTQGEGEAPDQALRFARKHLSQAASLAHLHYGVLALGDRSYSRFCGFGQDLDDWLGRSGAQALFARIDVNQADPVAIAQWHKEIEALGAAPPAPTLAQPLLPWSIVERQHLNPGSQGGPVFQIALHPPAGQNWPHWQAGDLVEIEAPHAAATRLYSIASLPHEGRLTLLVREQAGGLVSPHLCRDAGPISLRIKSNPVFHLDDQADRPLILIGNGVGLAGLRAHLLARIKAGQTRNWLIFGERQRAHDAYFHDEISHWQNSQSLQYADLCFSRDGGHLRYVQEMLATHGERLLDWVNAGAAIYVCGSARGMAADVDAMLAQKLGRARLDDLHNSARYRRDIF